MIKNIVSLGSVMLLLLSNGCTEEDKNPVDSGESHEAIPSHLFPLMAGHRFEFGGYLTSGAGETKVAGSDNFHASWTIMGETPLSMVIPPSKVTHLARTTATLIFDSVTVPGILSETKVTAVFVYYDSLKAEYYYLSNLGNFFRTYSIFDSSGSQTIRGDSLRFITLASIGAKTGNNFTVFQQTFQSHYFGPNAVPLTLEIIGNFERKENLNLTINGRDTTITAYYLSVINSAVMGQLEPQKSVNAKFWLAEGIGPVKFFLAGDSEAPGSYRTMTGKNF